jgi:hypothetical protein
MASQVAPQVFEVIDLFYFIATIASLVLAIVAIWLSYLFKRDADQVNQNTRDLLLDIRSDAKIIGQVVSGELREYGKAMRAAVINQNTLQDVKLAQNTAAAGAEFKENKQTP